MHRCSHNHLLNLLVLFNSPVKYSVPNRPTGPVAIERELQVLPAVAPGPTELTTALDAAGTGPSRQLVTGPVGLKLPELGKARGTAPNAPP